MGTWTQKERGNVVINVHQYIWGWGWEGLGVRLGEGLGVGLREVQYTVTSIVCSLYIFCYSVSLTSLDCIRLYSIPEQVSIVDPFDGLC